MVPNNIPTSALNFSASCDANFFRKRNSLIFEMSSGKLGFLFDVFVCIACTNSQRDKIFLLRESNKAFEQYSNNSALRKVMKKFRLTMLLFASVAFEDARKYFLRLQFCLSFRGLSLRGIDVLGRMGLGPCARTMMRARQRMLARAKEETNDKSFSVIWIDNYSKILACQKPKGDRTFKMNLWTVVVGKSHPLCDLPLLSAPRTTESSFYSKMSHWPSKRANHFLRLMKNMREKIDWAHELKVAVVPLKPDARDIDGAECVNVEESTRMKNALVHVVDGPRHLVPIDLMRWNIGSNEGLYKVLEDLNENISVPPGNLQVIVSDCNIFARIIKV